MWVGLLLLLLVPLRPPSDRFRLPVIPRPDCCPPRPSSPRPSAPVPPWLLPSGLSLPAVAATTTTAAITIAYLSLVLVYNLKQASDRGRVVVTRNRRPETVKLTVDVLSAMLLMCCRRRVLSMFRPRRHLSYACLGDGWLAGCPWTGR